MIRAASCRVAHCTPGRRKALETAGRRAGAVGAASGSGADCLAVWVRGDGRWNPQPVAAAPYRVGEAGKREQALGLPPPRR
ncbi:hypothetical protein EMIT0111MI5_150054 [Burkholderia sp. IT-111MI5]